MPRFWTCLLCWAASVLLVGAADTSAQAGRPGETLLPDTTQGFFAISNVDVLTKHWDKTQLGHLMADPVMKPFEKDIRRQFDSRWSNVHERLGLTLDDMRKVPGGDVAIGLIGLPPVNPKTARRRWRSWSTSPASCRRRRNCWQRTTKTQLERGAKRSEVKMEGCPDPDHPVRPARVGGGEGGRPQHARRAAGTSDKSAPAGPSLQSSADRQAFYCLTGNLLVVTDDLGVMSGILGRALRQPPERRSLGRPQGVPVRDRPLQEGPRQQRRRKCVGLFIRWVMPKPFAPPRPSTSAARERAFSK